MNNCVISQDLKSTILLRYGPSETETCYYCETFYTKRCSFKKEVSIIKTHQTIKDNSVSDIKDCMKTIREQFA